jgi:hypothetical protein
MQDRRRTVNFGVTSLLSTRFLECRRGNLSLYRNQHINQKPSRLFGGFKKSEVRIEMRKVMLGFARRLASFGSVSPFISWI